VEVNMVEPQPPCETLRPRSLFRGAGLSGIMPGGSALSGSARQAITALLFILAVATTMDLSWLGAAPTPACEPAPLALPAPSTLRITANNVALRQSGVALAFCDLESLCN